MYVCMYVCIYVCMYVCIYIYICICVCVYVCIALDPLGSPLYHTKQVGFISFLSEKTKVTSPVLDGESPSVANSRLPGIPSGPKSPWDPDATLLADSMAIPPVIRVWLVVYLSL